MFILIQNNKVVATSTNKPSADWQETQEEYVYSLAKNEFVLANEINEQAEAEAIAKEEAEAKAQTEIEALKQELASYDYIGVKIAMGVATVEDYADKIAYTETLRAKINELQNG